MTQPGIGALLWFFAIVALIPLALWLLKRSPYGARSTGQGGPVRHVASLPLSAQQQLVTVEVGQGEHRTWLLLGVTPHGIRTLHTMAPTAQPALPEAAPPAATFASLLQRLRQPGERGHGF